MQTDTLIKKHANQQPTILVVEDNDDLRDTAIEMLSLSGFRVLAATDAASGFAMFKEHPEIDLVFTDVIMLGGKSGIEMAKDILSEKPVALILFATGYHEKGLALENRTEKSKNIASVSKPYDVDEIPKLIKSMLAKAASAIA